MKNRSTWNVLFKSRGVAAMILAPLLTLFCGETVARAQLNPGDYTSLGTLTVLSTDNVVIDTSAGTITINGTTTYDGTTQMQGGGAATIAVFDFSSISIAAGANVTVQGTAPLALLSTGNATILAPINASGAGGDNIVLGSTIAGTGVLGGGDGGAGTGLPNTAATPGVSTFNGNGGNVALAPISINGNQDGAGGGLGGAGGLGGKFGGNAPGGNAVGVSPLTTLVGGGGGGGAPYEIGTAQGDQPGGGGGAGGGAIEIIASGTLTVSSLTSNGGTGGGIAPVDGGLQYGGGGAGGAIVLGGASVVVTSPINTNGGDVVFNTDAGSGGGGEVGLVGVPTWVLGSTTALAGLGFDVEVNPGANGGAQGDAGTIYAQTLGVTAPTGQTATFNGTGFTNIVPTAIQQANITVTLGSNLILDGGTLQFQGNSETFVSGNTFAITANGGTVDTQAFNDTVSSDITGPGSLTKIGSGTLILNGTNGYSGGTTISAGTIQAGSATALGDSAGSLAIDDATTLDLHGNSLTVGDFSGGTGTVTNGRVGTQTLTFGTANDETYAGVIQDGSGPVALVKQGSGTEILSGINTYTGSTQVNNGALEIDGSLASGSAVTVGGPTATGTPILTGTGIIHGAVTVSSPNGGVAGTINPGGVGTIGTLTVGSISFQSGSIFALDLNGATTDLLTINGAAVIHGGAEISISATGLTLSNYVLATALSGLDINNFTVIGSLPTGYALVQTATSVDLEAVASQTLTSPNPSTINIITGSTTTISALLNNTAASGGAPLVVNLADNASTGGTVTSLSAASGPSVAANSSTTVSGTFTAGAVGTGQTWSISNTDPAASPTAATTSGTANVYNHSAPTLTTTTGNNQSAIINNTLAAATATLSNTAGITPAPLDVSTLSNLTGTSGSLAVASGGTGIYTATGFDTSTVGVGKTLAVGLSAGDSATVIGGNALVPLSTSFTYNVYNHSAPTLTTTTGNNQSVFINGSLAAATATLADTAGTTPAPLDVSTLSNLTGATGSAVVGSGPAWATCSASRASTHSTVGIGKTLDVGLNAGDSAAVIGADALLALWSTSFYL